MNSSPRVKRCNYGWIVVIIAVVLFFNHAAVYYSYGIFFKPLENYFGWNRAATSGVFSLFIITQGTFAILMGWSTDKFGPRKTMLLCGTVTGLGLILSSRITELWQLYITYGLIFGFGMSGTNVACLVTICKWFTRGRGLAVGIASAAVGLGTSAGAPVFNNLITTYGWSLSYVYIGIATLVVFYSGAAFLKSPPASYRNTLPVNHLSSANQGLAFRLAGLRKPMVIIMSTYFLFSFCINVVMIHLVNYATDAGIGAATATTLISVLGIASMASRLLMGMASDRIGVFNTITICAAIVAGALLILLFGGRQLFVLYIFAAVFGLGYGAEIPQMAPLVGAFYGFSASGALVGMTQFGAAIGGAVGAWLAGYIFDLTRSYQAAFAAAVIIGIAAFVLSFWLSKYFTRLHTAQETNMPTTSGR